MPASLPLLLAPTSDTVRAPATPTPAVRLCHDCAASQRVADVPDGSIAGCARCGATLRFNWPRALDFALLASVASLLVLLIGNLSDLAVVERAGQRRTAGLLSGPLALADGGLWELSVLVGFVTIVAPVVSTSLLAVTLGTIRLHGAGRLRRLPRWLPAAFALHLRLRPWSMVEVFLVGYFVAYSKLGALVHITPGTAFFALAAFMLTTVAIDAVLDPQTVWEAMPPPAAEPPARPGDAVCCHTCRFPAPPGRACPRCGARLHRRKPNSLNRTAALGLAGLVLYVPANVFPVLTVQQLGRGLPSTILGGVWELVEAGEYPLAAIVFLASVAVPVLKIASLGVLLAVALGLPTRQHRHLTQLYRAVATIGRWSMIDIFMESILASLVRFGNVATIRPGPGAIAFAAVVVLTILAADSFDPRLMWDRVRHR